MVIKFFLNKQLISAKIATSPVNWRHSRFSVDDSVHILSKYITALRQGSTPEQAVQYSLDKAGSAITITTLSLAVGTFVLVFSNTFYFQNVALLLTPIIVVALLLDLLFLPPLLVKFDRRWGWTGYTRSLAS